VGQWDTNLVSPVERPWAVVPVTWVVGLSPTRWYHHTSPVISCKLLRRAVGRD